MPKPDWPVPFPEVAVGVWNEDRGDADTQKSSESKTSSWKLSGESSGASALR